MRKIILMVFSICLIGCERNPFDSEMKCIDGKVFIKSGGIWLQAKMYETNECREIK